MLKKIVNYWKFLHCKFSIFIKFTYTYIMKKKTEYIFLIDV